MDVAKDESAFIRHRSFCEPQPPSCASATRTLLCIPRATLWRRRCYVHEVMMGSKILRSWAGNTGKTLFTPLRRFGKRDSGKAQRQSSTPPATNPSMSRGLKLGPCVLIGKAGRVGLGNEAGKEGLLCTRSRLLSC